MKVEDSGMPDEVYWDSLFDIPEIIDWLDLQNIAGPIVEIGCGYGTFTIPIASQRDHEVIAFDISQEMIGVTAKKAQDKNLPNVCLDLRDVAELGTGLEPDSIGLVLLFNILHSQENRSLLEESVRILRPGGRVAIVHWRKDTPTPRGPNIDSRPEREGILEAVEGLNLHIGCEGRVFEPYHWGIQLIKRD